MATKSKRIVKAPKTGDKSASPKQRASTTAHLMETTAHQLAHTISHLKPLKKKLKDPEAMLDWEHAMTHLKGGIEHNDKLMHHMDSNYPKEARELRSLQSSVSRSDVGETVKSAADIVRKNQ